jgi:hypothetical protein
MGVIECGVVQNEFNRLVCNGIGVIECGVERNGCNRIWCGTEWV